MPMPNFGAQVQVVVLVSSFFVFSTHLFGQDSWSLALNGIGTFSSPRCADLNQDGIKDIIIGAGREEFVASDSAVIAIDGATGQILWHVSARDQIFASAALTDLNGDRIVDVVIGGRSAELKAINGRNGDILWEFFTSKSTDEPREAGWYNFYNAQFIEDVDGDKIADILIANGGDVKVEPYNPDRPAGHLLVLSGASGILIAKADMPDGKETYCSLICFKPTDDQPEKVVFGTGGETLGGSLFVADLKDILRGDLSKAFKLASSPDKGFIAPPVAVDLNQDNTLDLAAIAVDGTVYAFDGQDFTSLWKTRIEGCEAYSSIALGDFTGDEVPDLFLSIAAGVWPKLEWNRQFMLDGKDGTVAFIDSLGFYQTSSAVAFDFTGDGLEEAIISLNYQEVDEYYRKFFRNIVVFVDFSTGDVSQLGDPYLGSNISSTPWIGDLDGDQLLDIIYVHSTDERHTYTFNGMQIDRIETQFVLPEPIKWGAYMGTNYNGIFR